MEVLWQELTAGLADVGQLGRVLLRVIAAIKTSANKRCLRYIAQDLFHYSHRRFAHARRGVLFSNPLLIPCPESNAQTGIICELQNRSGKRLVVFRWPKTSTAASSCSTKCLARMSADA